MKLSVLIFTIFLSVFIGLLSCRKDKTANHDNCSDFITSDRFSSIGLYIENGKQFKAPCFNPNNPDEFVFYYQDYDNQEYSLFKYNINSGQKTKIVDLVKIISQPKWGKKGWIAFDNVLNYQISIVKDNGDSLTQISNNTSNLFPAWSADGSQLYWQHSPVLGYPYYLFRLNLNNQLLDTIYSDYAGYNDISPNNILISKIAPAPNQQIYFGTTNLNSNVNFEYQLEIGLKPIEGLTWHPDGISFFYSEYVDGGLKKFNTLTKQSEVLVSHCQTKFFRNPSCSPDGKKLILEKVNQAQEVGANGKFTGNVLQKATIVIIDLQTGKETNVDLE